jgi:hypothetical protein
VRCFQPLSHLSDVPENDAFPRGVRSCNEAGAVKQGQAGPGAAGETDAKQMRSLADVRRVIGGRKRRMGACGAGGRSGQPSLRRLPGLRRLPSLRRLWRTPIGPI